MRSYEQIKELWEEFKDDIKYKNRYFVGKEIIEILDRFDRKECNRRGRMIGPILDCCENDPLYRARIGNYYTNSDENKNCDKEMLAPPKGIASSGRCNPEGISYLYLASNELTAINEVKPNIGDVVTVAEIFVDTTEIFDFRLYDKQNDKIKDFLGITDYELQQLIYIINDDLKSVITIENKREYLPLQFIAEYVKNKGFNGFSYASTVGNGTNYVLFDLENEIKIKRKYLKKINYIEYKYEDIP